MSGFTRALLVLTALLATAALPVHGRIKLITLPERERVEIQLDRPGVTLVEEERTVPLLAGENLVDFSWGAAPVDRESIVFRVVPGASTGAQAGTAQASGAVGRRIQVLAVSYPPGENALVWTLYTDRSGPARVRISYLMGQLDRGFSYRAVASAGETHVDLSRHVRIANLSGEGFGEAELWLGHGERLARPVDAGETREVLVERIARVPVRKTYTVDPAAIGYLEADQDKLRVAMRYVIENAASGGAGALGRIPLPPGKVRIFQDDGTGGSAFLGEDWAEYTPPGESMTLDIGVARDVTVRRVVEQNQSERIDGDLHRREVVLRYEIENFKDQPVTLELVEEPGRIHADLLGALAHDPQWSLGARTSFADPPDPEHTSAERLLLRAALPAARDGQARKVVQRLHLVYRNEW